MSASLRRYTRVSLLPLLSSCLLVAACASDDDTPGANSGSGGASARGGSSGSSGGGAGGSSGDAASGSGGTSGAALTTYKPCRVDMRSGEFVVSLTNEFTGVAGTVLDGIEEHRIGVEQTVPGGVDLGACRLMKPPTATAPCSPMCSASQVCNNGTCKPKPLAVSVGDVVITGLISPLTLKFIAGNYINPPGMTPHPLFVDGANLTLSASGAAGYGPFALKGYGVEPLVVPPGKLLVEMNKPVTVTWMAPKNPGPAKVHVDFSINRHGGTDSWLECLVDDNGSYTINAGLMTELFKQGVSGFPSVTLSRQSVDQTTVKSGCVHMVVKAENARDLDIPGVQSCKDDTECTKPQVCLEDLRCGAPPAR